MGPMGFFGGESFAWPLKLTRFSKIVFSTIAFAVDALAVIVAIGSFGALHTDDGYVCKLLHLTHPRFQIAIVYSY